LMEAFKGYINVALEFLKKEGVKATPKKEQLSLEEIIMDVRRK